MSHELWRRGWPGDALKHQGRVWWQPASVGCVQPADPACSARTERCRVRMSQSSSAVLNCVQLALARQRQFRRRPAVATHLPADCLACCECSHHHHATPFQRLSALIAHTSPGAPRPIFMRGPKSSVLRHCCSLPYDCSGEFLPRQRRRAKYSERLKVVGGEALPMRKAPHHHESCIRVTSSPLQRRRAR